MLEEYVNLQCALWNYLPGKKDTVTFTQNKRYISCGMKNIAAYSLQKKVAQVK